MISVLLSCEETVGELRCIDQVDMDISKWW